MLDVVFARHARCRQPILVIYVGTVNGEGVNIAMGYFLFPLVMVLLGRIWLKETLSTIQIIALCIAACGVAHELWHNQPFMEQPLGVLSLSLLLFKP